MTLTVWAKFKEVGMGYKMGHQNENCLRGANRRAKVVTSHYWPISNYELAKRAAFARHQKVHVLVGPTLHSPRTLLISKTIAARALGRNGSL